MHFSIMQLAMAVAIAIDFTVANFVAQFCWPIWLATWLAFRGVLCFGLFCSFLNRMCVSIVNLEKLFWESLWDSCGIVLGYVLR